MPNSTPDKVYQPQYQAWAHRIVRRVAIVSGAALLVTIVVAFIYVRESGVGYALLKSHERSVKFIVAAVWTIFPPVWFWIEYFFLFRKYGDENHLEAFKHGQQVAAAIWAGLLVLLFAASELKGP
jgi:hypothetical protein